MTPVFPPRRLRLPVLILAGLVALSSPAHAASTNSPAAPFLSQDENEVVKELNLARSDPAKYAVFVKQFRVRFINEVEYKGTGGATVKTQEGVKAVDEAIEFLKKAKRMPALKASEGLSLAAKDHVEDTGKKGLVGHDGSDGSTAVQRMERYGKWEKTAGENIAYGVDKARDIVIQLIVDDGVPGRGHRVNIFTADYRTIGVAIGAHQTYRRMCVMDFAGGFQDGDKVAAGRKKKK